MRRSPLVPAAHLFVCANHRSPGDPLGEGCGDAGNATFDALKKEVGRAGVIRSVWVTRTHCLGLCPRTGCGVALYGALAGEKQLFLEVVPDDAPALVATARAACVAAPGAAS